MSQFYEIISDIYDNYIGRANTQNNAEALEDEVRDKIGNGYLVKSTLIPEYHDILTRIYKRDNGQLVESYSLFGENALREQRYTYNS